MHGARNDFVVLDGRVHPISMNAAFARAVCDRRAGIGADGAIAILPSNVADARMQILNADGSEAEMCGNGVRCVARYLCETSGDRVRIETLAGIVEAEILEREPQFLVRIAMGAPRFEERALPDGAVFVSMGNPHVVIFCADARVFDLEPAALSLQHDAGFPNGTNVHAASVTGPRALQVVHWERGAGMTQACGTGAAACAAAAIRAKSVTSPVHVAVPGGTLTLEWDGAGTAYLTGPAERVFDGVYRG